MGWTLHRNTSRDDLVRELLAQHRSEDGTVRETLAHELVGRELYAVERTTRPDGTQYHVITLFLLESEGSRTWGYKDMWEREFPYYFRCPQRLFALAPTDHPEALRWREACRIAQAGGNPRELMRGAGSEVI